MSVLHILVVTGASGAGKTATVQVLEARGIPGVRCFYLDSIGVPTAEEMERTSRGGEGWQAAATAAWLAQLSGLPDDVRVAVLDGQTRPSFVVGAESRPALPAVTALLLDCAADIRAARLCGPRQQPELATAQMDQWAAYLRGQADALHLRVIDTTALTVEQAADQLQEVVLRLIESNLGAA